MKKTCTTIETLEKQISILKEQNSNLTEANSGLEKAVFSFQFVQDFKSGLAQEKKPELTKKANRATSIYTRPSMWYAHCPQYCSAIPYVPWTKDCCIHPLCHRRANLKPHCDWFLTLQGNNQGKIMPTPKLYCSRYGVFWHAGTGQSWILELLKAYNQLKFSCKFRQ